MNFTVENICGLLIRSRLLTPEEIKSIYQGWLAETKDGATNVSQFLRWLVTNRFVTEYQANLIAKGHADNFFLNQYKILERLGRGRMAGVYKAIHQLGQVVAIKVLPPSRSKDPLIMARFRREARLALKLKHPNVVRTFQVGQANDLHYLVMEYLEGETLEELLQRRKKLEVNEAVRIIHQALLGLQHIHEQGMVHRDMKPANLMLVPGPGQGQPDSPLQAGVKILDIGLAREMFEESGPGGGNQASLTTEGLMLGTPDYLSPEQASDPRRIDIRADIYSLGCVLYHTLTGQPPFPDTNLFNQMVRHATEPPRPFIEFTPNVPEGLQKVLNWMMAKKPDERYPNPGRAAQALEVFLVADAAAPHPQEDGAPMHQFLTWLETTSPGSEAPNEPQPTPPIPAAAAPVQPPDIKHPHHPAAKHPQPTLPEPKPEPPPTAPPATKPVKNQPAVKENAQTAAPAKPLKPRKPTPAGARPKAPPPASPPAPATPEIDVELLPDKPIQFFPRRLEDLSRRDWVLLAAGATLVILLELLILGLTWVFKPQEEVEKEPGKQNGGKNE